MELGLEGSVVLVSGASRGIGLAIAEGFFAEGAKVALVARDAARLEAAARSLDPAGARAVSVVGDVSTDAGAAAAFAGVEAKLGPVDVLVNNVGGSLGSGKFGDVSLEEFRRVLDVNLWSAVALSEHAVRSMKRPREGAIDERPRGGVILHVSSISAREYCSSAPYAAAKSALTGLTKEMGVDLAPSGIRVSAIAPGSILFEGGSWDRRSKEMPERIEKMKREELPWGRFGTVHEVADVAVFLASRRASWITGSTIVVDGAQGRAL
jgi:3-oxoacyl-[acyl-carrier protein] reductase